MALELSRRSFFKGLLATAAVIAYPLPTLPPCPIVQIKCGHGEWQTYRQGMLWTSPIDDPKWAVTEGISFRTIRA